MFLTIQKPVFTALVALSLALAPAAAAQTVASQDLAVASIHEVGFEALEALKATPGVAWWVELDDQLLVSTDAAGLASLEQTTTVRALPEAQSPKDGAPEAQLYLLRTTHQDRLDFSGLEVLAAGGGWAVVRSAEAGEALLRHLQDDAEHPGCARHDGLFPLQGNTILAQQVANQTRRRGTTFDPSIQALVDAVDGNRWLADITTLASFNRWTHGTDILNARQWLVDAFDALPGLTVETPTFTVGSTTAYNVLATLPGTTRPDDWYIVGAHYDSISQSSSTSAPGAEDNASGCAGVLEMARILTANPPEATILFMCYSGEEQGLHGSTDHASGLVTSGNDSKVQDVLIMDMIGYTGDADLDCLLEANSASQSFIDVLADAGAAYTNLRIVTSLNPFGSDHIPYLNRGMRSVLTIENDYFQYPGYHNTGDLPANISLAMGLGTLRMNMGALAHLAGAGAAAAFFSDGFESGNTSAWNSTVSP